MSQEDLSKEKSADKEDSVFLQGPQRKYLAADTLWKHRVGSLSYWDVLLTIAIIVGYAAIILKQKFVSFVPESLYEDESDLWEAMEYYRQGKFHLSPLGALGIQLYSLIPRCKPLIRMVSLAFASATLGILYLGERRAGISRILSLASVSGIGYLPLFQLQASQMCVEPLQWFFLSLVFYFWQSFTYYPQFGFRWTFHLILLSVSLGLSVSTKNLGFATWAWICALALLQFWNTIGDVKLSTCFVAKYAIFQVLLLTIIPTTIFVTSNTLMLSHWTQDSPEFSRFMSSNFKSFLRGPIEQPVGLNYGSVVTLRHLESLGGYLHSHNYTYETGSFEQQVTLTQEENDFDNEWIVEYKFPDEDKVMINKKIHDGDEIRLRHRTTGKLLRASQAKPPVSSEEYDMEISGTGDWSYPGDSDELWKIRIVNGPRHSIVKPLKSIIKLQNDGHPCELISHDIRLPNWGFNQQEVLCVDEAAESRTHFYFETAEPVIPGGEEYESFYCEKGQLRCTADLLIELWQRQFKYNYYEKNNQLISPYVPETWPFNLLGDNLSISIWIWGAVFPVVFAIYQALKLFNWNPYGPVADATLNSLLLDKVGTECTLGWFIHYNPFFRSPHLNLDVTLYIPALLLGQIVVAQVINALYKWNQWTLAVLVAYCAVVFYT
ncbi:hypothetical protein ZYGR_0I05900 [Zygosaccharomyces rouxii]|uniref:dolichyl-phosphate-mannose--protein mannosyltransferase n=2 Tax=Zygosaccharomyces rouxii TaxID=4956 RepID=C5DU55_ZYGRC|nr:uncharacterized protein ZYRO0C14036g [Zygosaccharomyces rouxii]KAH9201508.1 hypothetical protein LQ764DRAFT_175663 [Zygosaccharomyces rouxii]GAV48293.1 hypothetical protein ZYGR_0I05900 [Zygosaccharomyces rouxii]CAR27316.1 ZYRO0C14036p [Zygosaccharomyces rouxii]